MSPIQFLDFMILIVNIYIYIYIRSKHLHKHTSYIISQSPNQNQPLQPTKRSTPNHFSKYPRFVLTLCCTSPIHNYKYLILIPNNIHPQHPPSPSASILTRDVFLLVLNARPGSCASTIIPLSDLEFRTTNDGSVMGVTGFGARS